MTTDAPRDPVGTEAEVATALEVLARLSATSEDGVLRDSIARVRDALWDVQEADHEPE